MGQISLLSVFLLLSISVLAQTEVELRTDGIVVPRTTTGAVSNPVEGMLIYDTSVNAFRYYDGTGWQGIGDGSGSGGAFQDAGSVVNQVGDVGSDDFIFGRSDLPTNGEVFIDTFFFYDQSKGAFRSGHILINRNWSPDSIGFGSHAWGRNTKGSGGFSTAFGLETSAEDFLSTAWGNNTRAMRNGSTAWGISSQANESYSTAWGESTQANGSRSSAWGRSTKATGRFSTSWGQQTEANGNTSTAWGGLTQANGFLSTAWGENSIANGTNSTAVGKDAIANGENSFVIGQYNDTLVSIGSGVISTSPLFIIGNGESGTGNESNAMVVRKDGHVGIGDNDPDKFLTLFGTNDNNTADMAITSQDALIELGLGEGGPHGIIFGDDGLGEGLKLVYRTASNSLDIELGADFSSSPDIFSLHESGNLTIAGNLTENSDRRLKKDISVIKNAGEIVDRLSGYRYNWKEDIRGTRTQIGLIAQELQEVLPELVYEDEQGVLSVDYTSIIPLLIESIKTERSKSLELEKRIEKMERKMMKD